MGFPSQGYWSRLSFPPPVDLPHTGIESESPMSPALAEGFFTTNPPGKAPIRVIERIKLWVLSHIKETLMRITCRVTQCTEKSWHSSPETTVCLKAGCQGSCWCLETWIWGGFAPFPVENCSLCLNCSCKQCDLCWTCGFLWKSSTLVHHRGTSSPSGLQGWRASL